MQVNISKTLEGILARTAFRMTKQAIRHHLKDHLMLSLLEEEGGLAYQVLTAHMAPWELYQLRLRIEQAVLQPSTEQAEEAEAFYRRFSITLTARFAELKRISTAHALIVLADDPTTATSALLARYRITAEMIAAELTRLETDGERFSAPEPLLPKELHPTSAPITAPTTLERFGRDLTREAREGRIDPVIGRDKEIERLIHILARRKKNNPLLVGEAGVGKTAVVEGLALRLVAEDVPHTLRGKRLFALDLSALIAGTKFRGEFEERMQQLMEELRGAKDTILFIDEIHTLVGAGATQGALDAANILKPALARGELQTIGATTLDEYRRDMERDSALERRFQRILIEAPTADETLEILRRIAPTYEAHHRVRYSEEALQACVRLTDRYLSERAFPDKAIDLMDEAGARAHLRNQLPTDPTPTDERHEALAEGRYEEAAALRVAELKRRIQEEAFTQVDRAHIEALMTELTGIPLEQVAQGEAERLRGLGSHLRQRIIGQEEATEKLTRAILRARAGLKDRHRPIGVFLFVGPTGVGKTLLAKELAEWFFDGQRGLIRLDMSEYSEKHNIARLIGSPPGYVGYGEGGQLTEAVRRRPYAVVLFDEIEKAHPEVYNTLLQLFDEGHLTDGAGRKVDFRNTVLIMTSNIGSRAAAERPFRVGYSSSTRAEERTTATETHYRKALERTFAPELLNRIDEVVLFRELNEESIRQIVELEVKAIITRAEQLGYRLQITEEAKHHLATVGYEPRYGARSLKRTLTEQLETPLAELIVGGTLPLNAHITLDHSPTAGLTLGVA